MSDIQSYIEECTALIQSGSNRDDIDQYLKKKGIDAKKAAAVHFQLQDIFVEKELTSQRKEDAWSNIAAGGVALLVNTLFTIYIFITSSYTSLSVSGVILYIGYRYISKGWKLLNNIKDEENNLIDKESIFDKKRGNYIPKR